MKTKNVLFGILQGIRTRNTRLAIIRSFVNYLLLVNPVWSADLQGILVIPKKKSAKKAVDYLSQEEINLLLEAPDPATWSGQRDRVLLLVMYNTGARVSEIIQLKVSDVKLESRSGKIHLYGKGRKERSLPLWRNTVKLLKEWIKKNGYSAEMPLIPNSRGKFMSRWGITNRLSVNVSKVAKTIENETICPSIPPNCFSLSLSQKLIPSRQFFLSITVKLFELYLI